VSEYHSWPCFDSQSGFRQISVKASTCAVGSYPPSNVETRTYEGSALRPGWHHGRSRYCVSGPTLLLIVLLSTSRDREKPNGGPRTASERPRYSILAIGPRRSSDPEVRLQFLHSHQYLPTDSFLPDTPTGNHSIGFMGRKTVYPSPVCSPPTGCAC
jgi:hypothetical protein